VIVYVWGNLTADNFTPRADKDMKGTPGQKPGLSSSTSSPKGRKAQGIDLELLKFPLVAFADEVGLGGREGHVALVPVDQHGNVDVEALEEWASFRGSEKTHPLTQALLDAVVKPNYRSES